jgi:protocatechuate 3,4-dioxygenase beta subunit
MGGNMTHDNILSRRNILKVGGLSALAIGAHKVLGDSLAAVCEATPKQSEGPFYPVTDQLDKNNDLTLVQGKTDRALGTLLYLSGKVIDQNCNPVSGVTVEIWQACESGRYNHPGDVDNPGFLDPNFQYWGIAITNHGGAYNFKTIIPGHYEAEPGWIRPPHIHFKVHKRGIKELITQMYFAGNRYNEEDIILNKIPRSEWESVVRPFVDRAMEDGRRAIDMTFDITVEKLVMTRTT